MSEDALIRLGQSSSEAVTGVLEMFAPGKIHAGDVTVVPSDRNPMESLPVPAVATSVSYVDGVTGANVFVMTLDGARKLAAAMMGMEEPEDPDAPELSELELSAVSEAMNQMMASAAIAISSVLGTEVEIGTPETRTFTDAAEALDAYPQTPHAVRATFSVCGEPCKLVQLVPNAFVVRMSSALDELGAEVAPPAERTPPPLPRRAARAGPRSASPRSRASPCACGPSSAGRRCHPRRWSACPPARWWSSTDRPTSRSTCTSTVGASPPAA